MLQVSFQIEFLVLLCLYELLLLRLLSQDRDTGLEVRWLNIGDQPPLETRSQALFKPGNVLWWLITGQHDLFLCAMQGVECVEELFLSCFLPSKDLNIVHE